MPVLGTIKGSHTEAKIWSTLEGGESSALDQIRNIASLPWVFKHVAIMGDFHWGNGATVGSVIAMKDAVSPAAVGVDLGCFTGDTKVPCLDGVTRSLKDMADTGSEYWVYSNVNGKIVPALGKSKKTRLGAKLVQVTLDNDVSIKCTPDHKFMLRDGTYVEAENLLPNDSLMPLYITINNGYTRVKKTDTGKWRTVHWLIAESGKLGNITHTEGQRTIIHHKDFNGLNNTPDNLVFMGDKDHSLYHRSLVEKNTHWQSEPFEAARKLALKKLAASPEGYKMLAERGTKNITKYMQENREEFLEAVAGNGVRGKQYLHKYNTSSKGRAKSRELSSRVYICQECNTKVKSPIGFYNHRKNKHNLMGDFNHTVKSVITLEETQDVYCMTVPETHNFGLDAGVFVHNCGMGAIKTNLLASDLPDNLHKLRMSIEKVIPVGFNAHDEATSFAKTEGASLWKSFPTLHERVQDLMSKALKQCGTLGGGNHFLSLDLDQNNNVWMLLHSGSRNIGKELAESHIKVAKTLEHNKIIVDRDLSVFLAGTPEFKAYRRDLFWAQEYAFLNRRTMFELYKDVMKENFPHITFQDPILCHHNYVAEEIHYGEHTFVTRKGAINAEKGVMGIIPGSIATGSYIVEGLGNPESFNSASHGAGRKMSRGAAKRAFTLEDVVKQTLGVECRKDIAMADELPQAYKDIETVMANQQDLVTVKYKLKSLMTVKG